MGREETGVGRDDRPMSRSSYFITTFVIYFGNISYACAINSFSPSLTDFKNKYGTDTSTISVVFVAAVACYMVGALACTVLYNLINRQFCVVILFTGMATSMLLAPHVPTLTTFYVVGGLLGFCIGCYDTAQIVWIMEMWQSKSAPFIQAQHFCYGIGTVLAPVIISPFLKNKYDEDYESDDDAEDEEKNGRLFIPYTIIGCLCGSAAVAQLFLFIFMRYRPPPPEMSSKGSYASTIPAKKVQIERGNKLKNFFGGINWPTARLVILTAVSLGFYQGMEMCTMQLFPTFGQKSLLRLTEAEAANTLTGLTIAFTVGRGLSVLLVLKIPPQFICVANIILVAIGNVIIVVAGQKSSGMLWAAAILYGSGFSSFLPSFCAFMERFLIFSNAIGAMMVVTGSVVGAIYPLIVGEFIDDYPIVISFPIFFSIAVLICSVSLSYKVTRGMTKRINE